MNNRASASQMPARPRSTDRQRVSQTPFQFDKHSASSSWHLPMGQAAMELINGRKRLPAAGCAASPRIPRRDAGDTVDAPMRKVPKTSSCSSSGNCSKIDLEMEPTREIEVGKERKRIVQNTSLEAEHRAIHDQKRDLVAKEMQIKELRRKVEGLQADLRERGEPGELQALRDEADRAKRQLQNHKLMLEESEARHARAKAEVARHRSKAVRAEAEARSWRNVAGVLFRFMGDQFRKPLACWGLRQCQAVIDSSVVDEPIAVIDLTAVDEPMAYNPSHAQAETANPVANLEEMRKGYAAWLACKFSGDFAAHLGNVSAVTDSYNMDVLDMCYCFLCLEAITNSEGVGGLAIESYGLNSYSARIWIVSFARFVKFAQGHHWAEDADRVRPLAEEWKYQAEHFLQMIKSCGVSFQRKL